MKELERKYALDRYIYFHREILTLSRDGRDMDVITISSRKQMTKEFEPRFNPLLFPHKMSQRPRKFENKKYVFITSRVHPGETAGSHVFNGVLKQLLNIQDKRTKLILDNFVFILIPMLNPDGVYRGHYRVDT